jgi:D-sedoheptulose 7-phosphate isomerase
MSSPAIVSQRCDVLREGLVELESSAFLIERWAVNLMDAVARGGKILVAGNGGSAALAAHITGELLGRYARERPPLPAVWLGADQAALTAIANDYDYADVFARQLTALARPDDIFIALSTSGESRNLVRAAEASAAVGCESWAMTGPVPNTLATACDNVLVFGGPTAVVQEVQQIAVHLICEVIDNLVLGTAT